MIHDTIEKLESAVQQAPTLKEVNKADLLQLLGQLKQEVAELAKTNAEQAHSITGFAAVSTHEATRTQPNPKLLALSLDGLSQSVSEFEETHPRLVQVVNSICNSLSSLGI